MAYLPELHYCCGCGVYLGPDNGDGICCACDEEWPNAPPAGEESAIDRAFQVEQSRQDAKQDR